MTSIATKTFKTNLLLTAILGAFIFVFAGCEGGGRGDGVHSEDGTAPSISNLSYSPTATTVGIGGGEITIRGFIDFVDDDSLVSTLIIDLFDSEGNLIEHIEDFIQRPGPGTVGFDFIVNTLAEGDYIFDVYLIDTTDLRSNVLTGDFSVGGDLLFQSGLVFDTGAIPGSVLAGDLDGDGDLDLAVANSGSSDVSVLLNLGDGTFAGRVDYDAGDSPYSVAVGDLDGDGDLDLAVANSGSSDVSVLLNNGDGTFAGRVDYGAGDSPYSVAVGDLDGDGDLDLAVAGGGEGVSLLWNNGDGTFAMWEEIAGGDLPRSVGMWDLDGDGDLDLAVANHEWYGDAMCCSISVLLNNGDGTFAGRVNYGAGSHPYFVAAGDLDWDGNLDLAVTNYSYYVSVLLNLGDGTFAGRVDYDAGDSPYSVAVGDLDGDGYLDLAVANSGSDSVSVLLNLGDGTFAGRVDYGAGDSPYSVAVGDLDGDGDLDLAVANSGSDSVSVFLNNGNN